MKIITSKPPALNNLYGTNKWGGKYLKSAGVAWKAELLWKMRLLKVEGWAEPVRLSVELYTCRHQDNDGVLKVLQDTLQEAGVYKDDYWIFELIVKKHISKKAEERLEVEIQKITLAGD